MRVHGVSFMRSGGAVHCLAPVISSCGATRLAACGWGRGSGSAVGAEVVADDEVVAAVRHQPPPGVVPETRQRRGGDRERCGEDTVSRESDNGGGVGSAAGPAMATLPSHTLYPTSAKRHRTGRPLLGATAARRPDGPISPAHFTGPIATPSAALRGLPKSHTRSEESMAPVTRSRQAAPGLSVSGWVGPICDRQ